MQNAHPRRNRKGTKTIELWAWDVEDFINMNGPLAVQEYIQELISTYLNYSLLITGSDPSDLKKIIEAPLGVDINVWQYEHMRQFVLELNLLVTLLHGVCTAQTCPKMEANGSLYACAAHKMKQECSAIDYMTHNLDLATSVLLSTKNFSNRVAIPSSSIKVVNTVARRLYRLFSHCYYHHKEIFLEFENEMYLCARFTEFAKKFGLMLAESFDIPSDVLSMMKSY